MSTLGNSHRNTEPLTDIAIAQAAAMQPITAVGEGLGLSADDLELYGPYKAKISLSVWQRLQDRPDGHLVLVTAMTPTPAGEGKTTVTVGLGQALQRLGHRATVAVREPSLGPVMGLKGGAAGGGYAQVVPMEDINLHFTGDLHAVTAANNLLAAMLDNHIHHGNELDIDTRAVVWRRVMDINDRALRQIVIGLGGKAQGVPREEGFMISVASEVMAILCLAAGLEDMKERLGRVIVAYDRNGAPVTAGDLGAAGALATLLKDAIKPNLVQTLENTPALIHGGPFANIAHGCNSVLATRLGLKLSDYVVTEAGFGADLGAEKFLHIKCRQAGLWPTLAVVVATVRALKLHGGSRQSELGHKDAAALERGGTNLHRHIDNLTRQFGLPVVVALNRFPTDSAEELAAATAMCRAWGVPVAVTEVHGRGGEGGRALAEQVVALAPPGAVSPPVPRYLYEAAAPIKHKIEQVAKEVYRARAVQYTRAAERAIRRCEEQGLGRLPVCMAKTQYSFSDDPKRLGAPEDFTVTVREIRPAAGAGFIVALTGDIMTMPGLPRDPAAARIDIDQGGSISGLF